MRFDWTLTVGSVIQMVSFITAIAIGVWRVQEGMRVRHRQNTMRLDFMLLMINEDRVARGLPSIKCPYRLIIDP